MFRVVGNVQNPESEIPERKRNDDKNDPMVQLQRRSIVDEGL
jgi:hypothetical protein